MDARDQLKDRFEGCLLGGAIGDALGYPIEFWGEGRIFDTFGAGGIRTLEEAAELEGSDVALFSDDTQMTLFTANGLVWGLTCADGRPLRDCIWRAYQEWIQTQGMNPHPGSLSDQRMWIASVPALEARRAPGNTCLSAISDSASGGRPDRPLNSSKGCGGIMRVAPCGMVNPEQALVLGAEAAALTHGHPMGWLPAALLADLVARLVTLPCPKEVPERQEVLADELVAAALRVEQAYPDERETPAQTKLVRRAIELARAREVSDLDAIHELGKGWTGDESLYISAFCAVRHAGNLGAALAAAVSHQGDSDSTGATTGNILGALCGRAELEAAFDTDWLEESDLIVTMADDLARARSGTPQDDPVWNERYRR